MQKSAESIWNKPLTTRQKKDLQRIADKQKAEDDSALDFSDVPRLTTPQLKQLKRPSQQLVTLALDADVCQWLRRFGPGYSKRVNNVVRVVMSQGQ